ncbi:MAG TPA: lasso peptide isopeptide bond-forming cyclase [Bryobacteraceae bacterium]|nr:lasso peptide isopeptide bond-forming cyclase [Bryobacteraceae bacterium]
MSAICGRFHRDGSPAAAADLSDMLARLRHRGGDGEASWLCGPVGLGHSMLWTTEESVLERLPLTADSERYAITADARIDNREELLASLSLDHPDPGCATDSRIILAAYRKWGEECPVHLMGDFAFAIWDGRRKELFCACDPMGVKGLYYYLSPNAFSLASEVKALFALRDVPRRLNEVRVAEYLTTLFEDRAGTFYRDIFRLPGAHSLRVTRDGFEVRPYWALDPTRELRLASDSDYVEGFRHHFLEAVRCRTRSKYPIGAALSGGLDSSSIACAARNINSATGPLHTFSLIFPGLPESDLRLIDERPYIQAVLDTGGFQPAFIEADRLSPMRQIDRVHFHLDHANYAPNLYLHWAMYQSAHERGVRVFLDGFDGDATVSHGFERLAEMARTLRWSALRNEIRMLSENHLAGIRPRRIFKEYCIKPLAPRWVHLTAHWLRGRKREARSENIFISSELKRRTHIVERAHDLLGSQLRWAITRTARQNHWLSLNQALYAYTLELADKASAAFAIEARYPFFDRRLMEFCLALPAEQKLARGWNRWVQRRAMAGILPEQIQWRPRKGNLGPNFYRRLLDFERERLESVALGGAPELEPYVDARAMRAAYEQYANSQSRGQGECLQLFAAVNLALWLRNARIEA